MGASTYASNAILDCYLRGVSITAPSRIYVSLHTAIPGKTGASEVSTADWPSYARQDPAAGAAVGSGFTAAASSATVNEKQMLFPQHDGADMVTVGYWCAWDAPTGGNCLVDGVLLDINDDPTTKTISPSDELIIYPAKMAVTVS